MESQTLMENNSGIKKEIIRESKKFKGYCEINGYRLLNVIYFLDKINNELKMINCINNIENCNNSITKIESFYMIVIESLFIVSDCISNCKFMDFDNEKHLKTCKILDESISQKLEKLMMINRNYFESIDEDINKYKSMYNSKLEESTSMGKIISKYSFA
jgi:hypothetical protein